MKEALDNNSLIAGIQTSLSIVPSLERITINDRSFKSESNFNRIPLNLGDNEQYKEKKADLILPDVPTEMQTELSNFFQSFPITEANHGLKFIIDSDLYNILGSRQSIDYTEVNNQKKLERIGESLCEYFMGLVHDNNCLLYTSPSPRDATLSRMPSSA